MPFLSNSNQDIKEMLATIGVSSFEQLVANIPKSLRHTGDLNIPAPMSELEVTALVNGIGIKNKTGISFLGGGAYDHYIPAVVDALLSRSEFYTAYTPYQPEVSQGTLQAIYEFQSMICELTQMDVTNASMYEGGSALAEALLLAAAHTGNNKVLIAGTVNPRYAAVLETYTRFTQISLVSLQRTTMKTSVEEIKEHLDEQVAGVIIQHPNYFGQLEDVVEIGSLLQKYPALFIVHYDPLSLGLLAPPGACQADLAVAEGQVLGNHMNFGGPYLGLFSGTEALVRKLPGRLVGLTKDIEGRQGFVLTLQTREQHIRREKATSNICTNSGLMALAATFYLALLGKRGIRRVAELCLQKSHYLAQKLQQIEGVHLAGNQPFFKEFVVHFPVQVSKIRKALQKQYILPGIDLSPLGFENCLLVAVTEKRTRDEMDRYAAIVKKVVQNG
jgi:glycine dehydrogenase subunit 1